MMLKVNTQAYSSGLYKVLERYTAKDNTGMRAERLLGLRRTRQRTEISRAIAVVFLPPS